MKWGDILYIEKYFEDNFYSKRTYLTLTIKRLIIETFKISIQGKVFQVKAKEITGQIPDFIEDGSNVECENDEAIGNLKKHLEECELENSDCAKKLNEEHDSE